MGYLVGSYKFASCISREKLAQLFYNGGYGVGAVTGIAADVIVGNAVAKEMMQIGREIGGKLRGIQNVEVGTGTNTLTDAQKSRLNTLDNIIEHNLTESDFSGTLRDLQGNPVPNPQGDIMTI